MGNALVCIGRSKVLCRCIRRTVIITQIRSASSEPDGRIRKTAVRYSEEIGLTSRYLQNLIGQSHFIISSRKLIPPLQANSFSLSSLCSYRQHLIAGNFCYLDRVGGVGFSKICVDVVGSCVHGLILKIQSPVKVLYLRELYLMGAVTVSTNALGNPNVINVEGITDLRMIACHIHANARNGIFLVSCHIGQNTVNEHLAYAGLGVHDLHNMPLVHGIGNGLVFIRSSKCDKVIRCLGVVAVSTQIRSARSEPDGRIRKTAVRHSEEIGLTGRNLQNLIRKCYFIIRSRKLIPQLQANSITLGSICSDSKHLIAS